MDDKRTFYAEIKIKVYAWQEDIDANELGLSDELYQIEVAIERYLNRQPGSFEFELTSE